MTISNASQSIVFYAPDDMRGKWHAKRLITGEADCGSPVTLSTIDRISTTIDQISSGKIHPIICRRCAQRNQTGTTVGRLAS